MSSQSLNVMHIEDDPAYAALARLWLPEHRVQRAETISDGLRQLAVGHDVDVVLLDLGLPDSEGLVGLRRLLPVVDVPIVVVTGRTDVNLGLEAVALGAQDYLPKDKVDAFLLDHALRHAVERHRLAAQARGRGELIRTVAENTPGHLLLIDRDARIHYVNRAIRQRTPEEAIGTCIVDHVPLVHQPAVWAAIHACFDLGRQTEYETTVTGDDQVERHFVTRLAPVLTSKLRGTVERAAVLTTNVTEARQHNELLMDAVEACPWGVVGLDGSGQIALANHAAASLAGVDQPKLIGLRFVDVYPSVIKAQLLSFRVVDAAGPDLVVNATKVYEVKLPTASGGVRPIRVHDTVAGSSVHIRRIMVLVDLTEEAEHEEKLRRMQKMEAVGQLAGGVAHDFNNLLTVILGAAHALSDTREELNEVDRLSQQERDRGRVVAVGQPQRDVAQVGAQETANDDVDSATDLAQLIAAAERGAMLTRRLLSFARVSPKTVRALCPRQEAQRVIDLLRRVVPSSVKVTLVSPERPHFVLIDQVCFEQLLMNLILNARDALEDEGRVEVTISERADLVVINVDDDGPGIPLDAAGRVFEPFFSTKGDDGTGLGLATCYAIAREAGGDIHVSDSPLGGARFTMTFPGTPRGSRRISQVRAARERSSLKGLDVLLVEDDDAVRRIMSRQLRRLGASVLAAAGLEEALRLISDRVALDVLVSDVVMPDANGLQVAAALRERFPGLPVVFVSGYDGGVLREREAVSPGAEVLSKPFTPSALAAAIHRALGHLERESSP